MGRSGNLLRKALPERSVCLQDLVAPELFPVPLVAICGVFLLFTLSIVLLDDNLLSVDNIEASVTLPGDSSTA